MRFVIVVVVALFAVAVLVGVSSAIHSTVDRLNNAAAVQ